MTALTDLLVRDTWFPVFMDDWGVLVECDHGSDHFGSVWEAPMQELPICIAGSIAEVISSINDEILSGAVLVQPQGLVRW